MIHSWWVPRTRRQTRCHPGFINEAWARINKPGTYDGQCTELCGINHAFMPIVVVAVTEEEFATWVAQQKGQALPPPAAAAPTSKTTAATVTASKPVAASADLSTLMQAGEKVFLGTCAVCHQATGLGMPPTSQH